MTSVSAVPFRSVSVRQHCYFGMALDKGRASANDSKGLQQYGVGRKLMPFGTFKITDVEPKAEVSRNRRSGFPGSAPFEAALAGLWLQCRATGDLHLDRQTVTLQ
jgi:hypothetical protein